MRLSKKYILLISIFVLFLISPFSIQKQEVYTPHFEKNEYNQKNTFYSFSPTISIAYAETVDADGFLQCGTNWAGFSDLSCELVNFLHVVFVNVGNVFVGLSAIFMDFFLSHSIQSSSYRDSGFIEQGWEILRDVTNLVFIFALLIAAFKMVLGIGGSDVKKSVLYTILIALVVNFSLFISYAIIDVSNIFAHVFYNKIEQHDTKLQQVQGNDINTEISGKSASLAIANKVNPQQLFLNQEGNSISKGERTLMIIMAGVINGTLIYVFLSVAFLFLGRTIGLWLSAILAPLAFASITVPAMKNWSYIGFSNWFNSLLKAAFMAPVFLFVLYLAVQFMNVGIAPTGVGDFLNNILGILIPMAAIVVMLLLAKKLANKLSGDFAGTISGIVAKAAGGAVAVGSVALSGGVGLAGGAMRGVGAITSVATKGKYGKGLRNTGRGLQSTNFNFGQSRLGKFASKTTGMDMGARMGNISYMGAENKAFLGAAKLKESAKDIRDGRTAKEMDSDYQTEKGKIKAESGKWQDKINETEALERLNSREALDAPLKADRDILGTNISERDEAKNNTTTTGAGGRTYKQQQEETGILQAILDQTKKQTAENIASGGLTPGEVTTEKGKVTTAQGNLDSHVEMTFEGKVKKSESEVKTRKNEISNEVADEYDTTNKKIAQKIRRGEISSKKSKEDTDSSKK